MLIFFIHGVATRDVKYAEPLKIAIKNELKQQGKELPYFYASFWGNASKDVEKMWNNIDKDLNSLQQKYSKIEIKDCLRYRDFREGLFSEFVGDMFTYLNEKRGFEIRQLVAQQLMQFLQDHPHETELHIISHSLGSVILFDILFAERFQQNDPAFAIRSIIQNLNEKLATKQVELKSITTMGSPILVFNTMLGINPEKIREFAQRNQDYCFKWLNIIDRSDIIAYPLKSSFCLLPSDKLEIKDIYVDTNNHLAAKTFRSVGQELAAMALDTITAHVNYWNYFKIAQLIFDNLQEGKNSQSCKLTYLQKAIDSLKDVHGISIDNLKIHINDKPINILNLADGSGKLFHVINYAQIHHVYLFDNLNFCQFAGYVGWFHSNELKKAIELIEEVFC